MPAPPHNKNALGNKGGQKNSKYKKDYAQQAYKLCLLGATDEELAEFFEVSFKTINTWKKQHVEFLQSIKKGKKVADAAVAEKLFTRAVGYSYQETMFEKIGTREELQEDNSKMLVDLFRKKVTIKEVAPDPTSQIFWLKNRQKELWRDKHDLGVDLSKMSDEDLDLLIDRITNGNVKK